MAQRIALITGGMGGLGESISTKMHGAGYRVVVTHSPANKNAAGWNAEMKAKGYDFHPVAVDVADYDSCRACVAKVLAEVGAVDILVNNDGIVERGWGRIINVSSVNGSKGAFGQTNYSAAKAGMHGFTKALALEVARKGVTVNTISPGYVATKMVLAVPKDVLDSKIIPQIPVGRLGKPEEIAALVAYLCTEEAAFVTGANIAINGSQHMY